MLIIIALKLNKNINYLNLAILHLLTNPDITVTEHSSKNNHFHHTHLN